MKKMLSRRFIVPTLICLLPYFISNAFYARLPEQVATHFGLDGNPDHFAPRGLVAFAIPTIFLLVYFFMLFIIANEPKEKKMPAVVTKLLIWVVPMVSLIVQMVLISYALVDNFDIMFYISLLIGVMMLLVGNYLPKCRSNYIVGIRLPWTLASEANWNYTHRIAGYMWVVGSLIMIAGTFAGLYWMMLAVIMIEVIVTVAVSYAYYRRNGENEGG